MATRSPSSRVSSTLGGFVDLAVLDKDGDRCVVWFGDGAGGFPRQTVVPTGRRPLRFAAVPLESGATPPGAVDDLLIACAGDVFVAGGTLLAFADGSGGFTTAALPGAAVPTDVALVDLNADGRLDATLARIDLGGLGGRDLALARFSLLGALGTTRIDLYRNSGGGSLLGPTRIDEVLGPVEMVAGDVGERGTPRLCVALPALGQVRAYGPLELPVTPFAPNAEIPALPRTPRHSAALTIILASTTHTGIRARRADSRES